MSVLSQPEISVLLLELLHAGLEFGLRPLLGLHPFVLPVVGAPEGEPEGDAVHFELVGQVAQDEAFVVRHEHVLGVDEEDEVGRAYPCLDQVVYLQGVIMVFGETLQFLEFVQPIVEQACGDPGVPLVVGYDDSVHHLLQTATHLGTDEDQWISMELSKVFLQLLGQIVLSLVSIWIFDGFPLVDRDDHWPALFNHLLYQCEIVDDEGGEGIHEVDNDVGFLNVEHGAHLHLPQILFIILLDVRSVQTSSVNQFDLPVLVLDLGADGVTCGVGDLRDNHLFLSKDLVDECRFSYVGPTDEAYFDDVLHANVLDLCASGVGKALLWLDQKVFKVILIQILIFLGVGVDLPKIVLPLLDLKVLVGVMALNVLFQLADQHLKSLQSLFPPGLVCLFDMGRDGIVDEIQQLQHPSALLRRHSKHFLDSQLRALVNHFPFIEEVIALVAHQHYPGMAPEGLQVLGELDLLTRHRLLDIHNEQDEVGFMDGSDGLFEDLLLQFVAC